MQKAIWFGQPTLATIQVRQSNTIDQVLGIQITEIGDDYLCGTMPADHRTFQPTGRIHGGANVVLAESLGSIAANMVVDSSRFTCFGLDINANHLRGVSSGFVKGTARPIHLGRTTHVWEIHINNEHGKLSSIARLTMAVVANGEP